MRVQSRFPSPASALPAPASERPRAAPSRSGAPVVDVELDLEVSQARRAGPEVHRHLRAGSGVQGGPESLEVGIRDHAGDQSLLAGVAAEDVRETGG